MVFNNNIAYLYAHRIIGSGKITDLALDTNQVASQNTPGLTHIGVLRMLDRTGLSHWLLGLGCFLTMTTIAIIMLIGVRYPDPDMYRNSIAFIAIVSFFLTFYYAMGRGWHGDMIRYLEFDRGLESESGVIRPGSRAVVCELIIAACCATTNLAINDQIMLGHSPVLFVSVLIFYFIQWSLIIFSIDIIFRQLICLVRIVRKIRIDLLNADFYSNLANVMVRHIGLYIFGLCIIALSYIVFTEGELSASEMFLLLMPWYLPGLIILSLYIIPYNKFRKRVHTCKQRELNSIATALNGNRKALDHSLLKGEENLSRIDLMYYQDRIRAVREWPFTDRIRALVLFGILPPLTWVIAALIEIFIEGAL